MSYYIVGEKENEDVRILGTGQIYIYPRLFTIAHKEVQRSIPNLLFHYKEINVAKGGGGKARDHCLPRAERECVQRYPAGFHTQERKPTVFKQQPGALTTTQTSSNGLYKCSFFTIYKEKELSWQNCHGESTTSLNDLYCHAKRVF